MNLQRYKQNLKVIENKIFSYSTHVGTIDHKKQTVKVLGWWSQTTSKHINYVTNLLNYSQTKTF